MKNITSKNREYGYYQTKKGSHWTINRYYQNKWDGGVLDGYWDEIDENIIKRGGAQIK